MSLNIISARNCVPGKINQELTENQLLEWFANSGVDLVEKKMRLGDFEYHHFSSFKTTAERGLLSGHGRSTSRRIAAIKCAAEMIERQFMLEYFPTAPLRVLAERYPYIGGTSQLEVAALPAKELRTSNGWAVHFHENTSKKKAMSEAIERHLLLKSFFKNGWKGFNPFHQIKTNQIELYFLTSRFEWNKQLAGLVIAKSPLYKGVSFGYCLGEKSEIGDISFWENAIFESVDKILTLAGNGIDLSLDPGSWLLEHTKDFLEQDFDFSQLPVDSMPISEESKQEIFIKTFDLSKKLNLPFPFFASFAWGKNLIPLFCKTRLSAESSPSLRTIMLANGIEGELPERHPIL